MARYACYDHFEYLSMLERSIHNITKQLHHGLFSKKEDVIKKMIIIACQKFTLHIMSAPHKRKIPYLKDNHAHVIHEPT
jgi:hypothetical protein